MKEQSYGTIPIYKSDTGAQVLLVQHSNGHGGHWGFPKGHGAAGEAPIDTARRELAEETGIVEIDIRAEPTFVEHYSFGRNGDKRDKTVTYFLGIAAAPTIPKAPDGHEIQDIRWVDLAEAKRLITYQETRALLAEVRAALSTI